MKKEKDFDPSVIDDSEFDELNKRFAQKLRDGKSEK